MNNHSELREAEITALMQKHNLVLDIAHAVKVDDEEKALLILDEYLTCKRQEWVEPEVCVCAAILAEDNSVYRGHRHGDCFRAMKDEGKMPLETSDSQGFMTTRNRFVTREEGRKLQDAAGIPSADKDGYRRNTLFSEDLYQADRDVLLAHLKEQS